MKILNVFYIEEDLVNISVDKQVQGYYTMCASSLIQEDMIKLELFYYSNVHIIENKDGFVLVYCDYEGHGTGPFKNLEKAKNWFLNQGR